MAVTVRLVSVSAGVLDDALAAIAAVTIFRTPNALHAELTAEREQAAALLARAGYRIEPAQPIRVPPDHRPAIVHHLEPIDGDGIVDIVRTRRVPLSETSAALLRRRGFRRTSAADRDHCRALLREMDAVVAWHRVVWCSAKDLGALSRRARMSPVVFDREAVQRPPTRWCDSSAGAIGRWATG